MCSAYQSRPCVAVLRRLTPARAGRARFDHRRVVGELVAAFVQPHDVSSRAAGPASPVLQLALGIGRCNPNECIDWLSARFSARSAPAMRANRRPGPARPQQEHPHDCNQRQRHGDCRDDRRQLGSAGLRTKPAVAIDSAKTVQPAASAKRAGQRGRARSNRRCIVPRPVPQRRYIEPVAVAGRFGVDPRAARASASLTTAWPRVCCGSATNRIFLSPSSRHLSINGRLETETTTSWQGCGMSFDSGPRSISARWSATIPRWRSICAVPLPAVPATLPTSCGGRVAMPIGRSRRCVSRDSLRRSASLP